MSNHNKNKCKCPCHGPYKAFNIVHEDSISDYAPPYSEIQGGKIYVDLDQISDTEKQELFKRFGPKHDVVMENDF